MKKAVVSFFVTGKITQAIKRVVRRLTDITEPIRPGRKFKLKPSAKRKHYLATQNSTFIPGVSSP
jgi:uncharacterized protein YcaQ